MLSSTFGSGLNWNYIFVRETEYSFSESFWITNYFCSRQSLSLSFSQVKCSKPLAALPLLHGKVLHSFVPQCLTFKARIRQANYFVEPTHVFHCTASFEEPLYGTNHQDDVFLIIAILNRFKSRFNHYLPLMNCFLT